MYGKVKSAEVSTLPIFVYIFEFSGAHSVKTNAL